MIALTIPISKKEKERLNRLAIRYGLSLPEFSRHILEEIASNASNIPEESLNEYENAKEIKESFYQSIKDEQNGKILKSLPKHLRPSK